MEELKLKFGIKVDKIGKGQWSFGAFISCSHKEVYLFINLFKISISIGRLYMYETTDTYYEPHNKHRCKLLITKLKKHKPNFNDTVEDEYNEDA